MKKEVNIMLIGCGHHARRIYVPSLIKISKEHPVKIKSIVDIVSEKGIILNYLKEYQINPDIFFLKDSGSISGDLPPKLVKELDKKVKDLSINAVIISTDPIYHRAYSLWALKNKLHILMDKPISTRVNAVNDLEQARGIYKDYSKILKKYNKLQEEQSTIFTVMTQRRYESGFKKVYELINTVAEKFNIPVTSIQAMHSDGVWIFPDEIVEQVSHPYSTGNGKCSHSGYHIFDIIWQIYQSGMRRDKLPDTAKVTTSFVKPGGLLTQFSQNDYRNIFGESYDDRPRRSEKKLRNLFSNYGENDAFSIMKLIKDGENICNVSINLLHNSFSRRSSVTPNEDLYKSNGRVKHQYYHIQQGPFQCIQIHNYQSRDKHDINTYDDYNIGGNNHFDINVFRNSKFFKKGIPSFETIKLNEITSEVSKLHNEKTKDLMVLEFIEFVLGRRDKKDLLSNIETHDFPARLISAIYESNARQEKRGGDSFVSFPISYV